MRFLRIACKMIGACALLNYIQAFNNQTYKVAMTDAVAQIEQLLSNPAKLKASAKLLSIFLIIVPVDS